MSIEILKDELKKEKIRNLYLLFGEEEYLKRRYLNSIEKIALKNGLKEMNFDLFEGKVDPDVIEKICETLPFMAEKRVVVLKNTRWFKPEGKETKKKNDDESKKIEKFLKEIPSHSVVVFVEDSVDKRKRTYGIIGKDGLVVECQYQQPMILAKWVTKEIAGMGKTISKNTADMLIDYCEPSMDHIMSEVEKLVLFVGDKHEIIEEDIKEVCHRSVKSRIFDLMDAIGQRKPQNAIKLFNDMVELREPIQMIYYMLARQFYQVLETKVLLQEGMPYGKIPQKIGVHPFVAGKYTKQANLFSEEELKKAVLECSKLDMDMKNSRIDGNTAVEMIIYQFARQ